VRGHRGMGIRSQRKTESAAGCRGMGSRPVRLTTPRYDPLVVTLHCTSVYVQGVVAANRETLREASIGPRKQKPRASGALTGATEGLGELEAARRQGSKDGAYLLDNLEYILTAFNLPGKKGPRYEDGCIC
jgi:hypothetical protein